MTADPKRRRRLRQWSRALVALALLTTVGMVVAFQSALHWIAERELSRGLDARVRIDRLRISLLRGRVQAQGLSIREKQGGRPLLTIRDIDLEIVPTALWHRDLLVTRLSVEEPEAWVALTPDGLSWLRLAPSTASVPTSLAVTLGEVEVRGGRIHLADRRRSPEHGELVEDLAIGVQGLSTRDDQKESRPALRVRGRWRRMTVSADGWVAPFAARRAFHLPVRVARADLGQAAGILPPGLVPAGLVGDAEVGLDIRGTETGDGWQVEAGVQVNASRVAARPRPDLVVRGRSLRLEGQGHWTPKLVGFSRLRLDLGGASADVGGRLQASVDRLVARGQADLDHIGLLVPEMAVEATALSLGPLGQPPAIRIGRIMAAGGMDQRAGTARLERVSVADVMARAAREADGSLDVVRWIGGAGAPGMGVSERHLRFWEILRLEVERAGLDLVDRGSSPERSLAIRDASLRLAGATSDPAQPTTFEFAASTSVAPTVRVSGSWVRAPMHLKGKAAIQSVDLVGLRSWLPVTLPLEVSSGTASLAVHGEVRAAPEGLATVGTADARIDRLRLAAGPLGSFVADALEVNLGQVRATGPGVTSMTLEVEGRVHGRGVSGHLVEANQASTVQASADEIQVNLRRAGLDPGQAETRVVRIQGTTTIRRLQATAPVHGLDSLVAREVQVDIGPLAATLEPGGIRMEGTGRVSLVQAEGSSPGGPVRAWKAAGAQMEIGRLWTAPLTLHVRGLEVDQPDVQVVRSGDARSSVAPEGGGAGLPSLRLDRLVVRNGRVEFRDEAVQPVWTARLTQVESLVEDFRTDTDAEATLRLSAVEGEGTRLRVAARLQPASWAGEVHAELENLDLLRPGPYLPELVQRVVRGGTASGALDLSLRRRGRALQIGGRGNVTFAPLELGDAARELTLLLAEEARVQVDHLSLDPLAIHLASLRLERPWIAVGRDRDRSMPALRLVSDLRQAAGGGANPEGAGPSVTIGVLTLHDGIVEIEDRAVRPRFREQVRNLEVVIEGLSTQDARKASVHLTGELGDRSTVSLQGYILPVPTNLSVDLEGQVRDFNLHRLNAYTAQITSYRLEQGKLHSQFRYRIEGNRLEAENHLRIDQLGLGERVEPEDRFEALVGVPLTVAVSLLQDPSGEISLRVPVHGDLSSPEFDLGDVTMTAITNALIQVVAAPFQMIGEVFTLGGRIGAIEIAPVLFAPGSSELDDTARVHLRNIAAIMHDRPKMKIKLSGMSHTDSDEDGLRTKKVEEQLQREAREPGVKGREDALDRLFLRTFGPSGGAMMSDAKLARLKSVQKVTPRGIEDLPDARTLSIYDYLAGVEGIERDRMFLAEGKLYRTAEGGGDWARRADLTILQP